MRRIELDFLQGGRRPAWARYLLLGVALAFAADLTRSYLLLRTDVAVKEARVAKNLERTRDAGETPLKSANAEDLRFARDTVLRLSMPWGRLFDALEAAQGDQVALLSIEPDADGGKVMVSGEAKDYFAVLTYVANLSGQQSLRNVHLTRHETRQNEPQRPIAFTVSAAWRDGR